MSYDLQAITYNSDGSVDRLQLVPNADDVPLSREFNCAAIGISRMLFPGGFDVDTNGVVAAPVTLEALNTQIAATGRMLVSGEHCETTIFADPHVNHCFRAWHDWCHWNGQHEFNDDGEYKVFLMQTQHIVQCFGDTVRGDQFYNTGLTGFMIKILAAEVMGNIGYQAKHDGEFPTNQRAFVEAYLDNPGLAMRGDF